MGLPGEVLRGGKGAVCAAAAADIATYVRQTGGRGPSGDAGDYCRARSKLSLPALRGLTARAAQPLEEEADPSRPRHSLHAKPIDGSTFTMPDTRDIKQTPGLDHVRRKTPERVRRELWATLLAYNLIRKLIATAAAVHGKQPRTVGFTLACQTVLSSWMLPATGPARDARGLWRSTPARIAANEVANRPGRIEPRALKRRRHRYPLMRRPRQQLRQELGKT